MADLKLLHKLLGMRKEERDELLKDNGIYKQHSHMLENKDERQRKLINKALGGKIKGSSVEENLRAYLGMKDDVNSMLALADKYLTGFQKHQYMEAVQEALADVDPAESSRRLSETLAAIRQEVLFAAGMELTGGSAEGEPIEKQMRTYLGAAMKYIKEMKKEK